MLTAFGATAVAFMMLLYALEHRGRGFILAFACGCLLSSAYGFLAGTWPFGIVEAIWAAIAVRRYVRSAPAPGLSRYRWEASERIGELRASGDSKPGRWTTRSGASGMN
jgi:hypothetical protein